VMDGDSERMCRAAIRRRRARLAGLFVASQPKIEIARTSSHKRSVVAVMTETLVAGAEARRLIAMREDAELLRGSWGSDLAALATPDLIRGSGQRGYSLARAERVGRHKGGNARLRGPML
jgi:hypothetical protein